MLGNHVDYHAPGTYDIDIGVSVDGQTATCTTQVILTDPCEDPSATFALRNPPSPAFENKNYALGDPEMVIMTWTWPQLVTQSIPT